MKIKYNCQYELSILRLKNRPMGCKLKNGDIIEVTENEKNDLMRSWPDYFSIVKPVKVKKEENNDM